MRLGQKRQMNGTILYRLMFPMNKRNFCCFVLVAHCYFSFSMQRFEDRYIEEKKY